jgi:hypothetical protein
VEIAATAKTLLSQRGVKTSHSNNLQGRNDSQGSKCETKRHFAAGAQMSALRKLFNKRSFLVGYAGVTNGGFELIMSNAAK